MNEHTPTHPKKGLFSFFKKTLDGLKSSVDYVKSIKEIFVIGISISALFLTDVPQEAVTQVKNLSASVFHKQDVIKPQINTTPHVETIAPQGIRRESELDPLDSRLSEREGTLRLHLREASQPLPPRESFPRVRVLDSAPSVLLPTEPIHHQKEIQPITQTEPIRIGDRAISSPQRQFRQQMTQIGDRHLP